MKDEVLKDEALTEILKYEKRQEHSTALMIAQAYSISKHPKAKRKGWRRK